MRKVSGVLLCFAVLAQGYAAEPVPVRTAALEDIARYPGRSAPATVESLNDAVLAAEIPARLVSLDVRSGDRADRDQVLARLECTEYRLAAQRAEASLETVDVSRELAMSRLERTRRLQATQSASRESLDEREAELARIESERRMALVALERARLDISRCEIRSPYEGVVTGRIASVGEYLLPGSPVLRIVETAQPEISARIGVEDAHFLIDARHIHFAFAGMEYPASVITLLPVVDTTTRTREIQLRFTGVSALPGAAGKLNWADPRPHVPAELLVERDGAQGVFLVQDGVAVFHPLPDAVPGRITAVDLSLSSRLIIEGQYGLKDRSPVLESD